ncbi:hypothetical protein [Bombella apis]|nr:hypothetical protein [Bombella apis]
MTTAIDLCRRALMRLGTQSGITAFDDGSVEAVSAPPIMTMCYREGITS